MPKISECTGPNRIKPAHTHAFSPMCVLFMCFYVFTFVITRAFGSAGAPGSRKRRLTQFDVVEFSPIRELKTGNKRKGEPLRKQKQPESEMQNVIAFSITFKSGLLSQCFAPLRFIHRTLLCLLSLTQPQWGIIGWRIGLWDTVPRNRWDLSPFYNLLLFPNSCSQLLPLPSGRE